MNKSRLLICSDIHGNLQALQAMLHKKEQLKIDSMVCLGDVVGYGADPEACFELLKEQDCLILKGNHEAMLLGESSSKKCSELGKQSIEWTAKHITEKTRAAIQGLPFSIENSEIAFFHAGPQDNGYWPYCNQPEQLLEIWGETSASMVFYGHTHRARLTVLENKQIVSDKFILKNTMINLPLQQNQRYLVNVGSVGQQRDSKTDAGFVVLEYNEISFTVLYYRILYNSLAAYQAIRHRGCGQLGANYLIRESWRRNLYGMLDNGRIRIRRK